MSIVPTVMRRSRDFMALFFSRCEDLVTPIFDLEGGRSSRALGNRFYALNAFGEQSRPANEGVTISYALVWDATVEAGIELGFGFMSSESSSAWLGANADSRLGDQRLHSRRACLSCAIDIS